MIIVHFRKNSLKCVVIYFSKKKEECKANGVKKPIKLVKLETKQ